MPHVALLRLWFATGELTAAGKGTVVKPMGIFVK
jgi:hypothetical protein